MAGFLSSNRTSKPACGQRKIGENRQAPTNVVGTLRVPAPHAERADYFRFVGAIDDHRRHSQGKPLAAIAILAQSRKVGSLAIVRARGRARPTAGRRTAIALHGRLATGPLHASKRDPTFEVRCGQPLGADGNARNRFGPSTTRPPPCRTTEKPSRSRQRDRRGFVDLKRQLAWRNQQLLWTDGQRGEPAIRRGQRRRQVARPQDNCLRFGPRRVGAGCQKGDAKSQQENYLSNSVGRIS